MAEQPVVSRKRAQTQLKLMKAATEVFAERGIIGSSVEQVCEGAGFTRGAFYSNFESKEALCMELLAGEKLFYQKAFAKGVAATFAHFAAHPQDKTKPPYELIEIALELVLPCIFGVESDEDEMWTAAMMIYSELGLYAVREPAIRDAYLEYVRSWTQPFAFLLQQVIPACGLEFTLPVTDAIEVLTAVFEIGCRDSLIEFPRDSADPTAATHAQMEKVKAALLRVARLITRPAASGPVGDSVG
jgi:AcrR family transcriptional regulator